MTSTACSKGFKTLGRKTDELVDNIGCKSAKSRMFDVLLEGFEATGSIVNPIDLEPFVEKRIKETWKNLSFDEAQKLKENILNFYKEVNSTLGYEERSKIVQESLAAFEVGVKDGVEYGYSTENISQKIDELTLLTKDLNLDCNEPEEPDDPIVQPEVSPVTFGSQFALAVAYQSCEVLDRKPMGDAEASVKGIKVTGTHPSGGGKKREIASLSEVQTTHYYIKNIQYEKKLRNSFKFSFDL